MSAWTCKRESGFATEPIQDRQGHGVVDTLLPHLAYHLLQEAGARFPVPFALRCATCEDRMEPVGGFYAVYNLSGRPRHIRFRPRYHAQTKVALSRRRRAAAEGMLYTASALSPHTVSPESKSARVDVVFVGRLFAPSWKEVAEALATSAIGALHTRGYGRIAAVEDTEVRLPPLRERFKQFNDTLRALWADIRSLATNAGDLPEAPDGLYFSVDLLAPGVFRDAFGVPSLVPTLRVEGEVLAPVFWITRPTMASGWSPAWGLPKPTQLAARMGSVFVYRWQGPEKNLLPTLESLERDGVGERRDEGFGECLVCHPFHQEVEET